MKKLRSIICGSFVILIAVLLFSNNVLGAAVERTYFEIGTTDAYTRTKVNNSGVRRNIGAAADRLPFLYVTNIDISGTLTVAGIVMVGNLDMDGYNIIMDTDGDTILLNDRDVGVLDDEIDLQIAGAVDFTFSANDLGVLAGSGVSFADNAPARFGNTAAAPDSILEWNTAQTVDGLYLGTATGQNTFIIAENGDVAYDFANGAQTHPTIFLQSANQTATEKLRLNYANIAFLGAGLATTATEYSVGRDADATNQLHFNVPTGAGYEWSVNDTALITSTATSPLTITQAAGTTGVPTGFTFTGAAHTGLTAATENIDVNFNLARNKTWAAGAGPLAVQRDFLIQGATYIGDAGGALTITDAATLYLTGGPIAGANMTITRSHALQLADNAHISFGTSGDSMMSWNTTQTVDGLYFGLSDAQNTFVIAESGDSGFDFAHGAQTNPTLFIHSAAQNTAQWVSLANDGTDSILTSGTGTIRLEPNGGLVAQGNGNLAQIYRTRSANTGTGGFEVAFGNIAGIFLNHRNSWAQNGLAVSDDGGNQLIFSNYANRGIDHDRNLTTDPTLFIFSDISADVSNNQWGSLAHDQVNFTISTGANIGAGTGATTNNNGFLIAPSSLTSGDTANYALSVTRTLNDAGAAGGADLFTGLLMSFTTTNVTGWNNVYFLDIQDDANSVFRVYQTGALSIGNAGVRLTTDGDGAITFLGEGAGSDEDFVINLDDTANTIALSSTTGVTDVRWDTGVGVGQFTLDGSTGGCIMLRDTDDAGWTEVDALDGVLTGSIDADGICE